MYKEFLNGSKLITDDNNKQLLIDFLGKGISQIQTKLLYRASKEGWNGTDFHRECDNKGWTLVIVQTTHY